MSAIHEVDHHSLSLPNRQALYWRKDGNHSEYQPDDWCAIYPGCWPDKRRWESYSIQASTTDHNKITRDVRRITTPEDAPPIIESEKAPLIGDETKIGPTSTSSTALKALSICPQPVGMVFISASSFKLWYSARIRLSHNWLSKCSIFGLGHMRP